MKCVLTQDGEPRRVSDDQARQMIRADQARPTTHGRARSYERNGRPKHVAPTLSTVQIRRQLDEELAKLAPGEKHVGWLRRLGEWLGVVEPEKRRRPR